jgi:hypothetical protein
VRVVLSAIGLVLLALAASAAPQDEKPAKDAAPWVELSIVDVIPSMVEEFVAVQRELTARAKESKTPWRTVSRTEVFGDTYRFFIASPVASLASFDKAGDDPALTALERRAERCISQRTTYAVRNLPDVSSPLPEGRQPGLMVINMARVFPGREQDYVNVMKSDFLPHFDEAKVSHVTGVLALGGEGSFIHVFYFESFAEIDKGSPVMRALGPEGAQAATAKLSGIVSSSALWVARLIPELSFGPPAATESTKR